MSPQKKSTIDWSSQPGAVPSEDVAGLYRSQVFIFSAHKTATQTIRHTLEQQGVPAIHAHLPENVGLTSANMQDALQSYNRQHGHPITIISVFREPLERLISSFFQSLQRHYYARTQPLSDVDNTRLLPSAFTRSQAELCALFVRYMDVVDGFGESLDLILSLWDQPATQLAFEPAQGYGRCVLPAAELVSFRFDQIINHPALVGKALQLPTLTQWQKANVTDEKPHANLYHAFKQRLTLEPERITAVYESRRHLIEAFYPGEYAVMLDQQIQHYAKPRQAR